MIRFPSVCDVCQEVVDKIVRYYRLKMKLDVAACQYIVLIKKVWGLFSR